MLALAGVRWQPPQVGPVALRRVAGSRQCRLLPRLAVDADLNTVQTRQVVAGRAAQGDARTAGFVGVDVGDEVAVVQGQRGRRRGVVHRHADLACVALVADVVSGACLQRVDAI